VTGGVRGETHPHIADLFNSKTLEIALPGHICLYPAEQACKSIAQNGQMFNEKVAKKV
jgi:hypothetical protein